MDLQAYTENERLQPILRHLDPELPDIQRMTLLAVAAGLSPSQFHVLPGLVNPSRTKVALRELADAGRVRRHRRNGWKVVAAPFAGEPAVARCIKRSKKIRRALDILADPGTGLRARGLEKLGTVLGPTLAAALDVVLRRVDNAMDWDKQVRRRRRLSVLTFVERRLPRDYAATIGRFGGPPAAPEDLLEITLRRLTEGARAEVRDARRDEIIKLYRILSGREEALAHWWQVLSARWSTGDRRDALWQEWRRRLESYLLRRRICVQAQLRVKGISPRRLKAMYPVPDCGYGAWVDEELELYRSFQRRYRAALGPFAHDLWIRSHEGVAVRLRQDYTGARPHMVTEDHYSTLLFDAADRLSTLDGQVLNDMASRRTSGEVRRLRGRAEEEWQEMPLRLAIAKAAKEAANPERSAKQVAWAVELLRIAAERELGLEVNEERLKELLGQSKKVGRGGNRVRPLELGVTVVRKLVLDLEVRPATLAPKGEFPISAIRAPVEDALRRVLDQKNVSPEERRAAVALIETFVRRRARMKVKYSCGREERKTVSLATRLLDDESVERQLREIFQRAHQALAA